MLLAPLDAAGDAGLLERALEGVGDLADEFLLIAAGPLQLPLEHLVAIRIQRAKAEILEFELDRVQTEALGDGRIDFERFAGDAAALERRHHPEGAHVVHAVGELDHDDADVAHHREQHLAEALGLRLLAVLELYLVEFADAVDEFGDHRAEQRGDLGLGGRRVFDDVVQDGGYQGVRVEAQVGEDVRNGHRMGDVGLAGNPLLALVLLGAEFVGFAHAFDLRRRQVGLELVQQLADPGGASSTG